MGNQLSFDFPNSEPTLNSLEQRITNLLVSGETLSNIAAQLNLSDFDTASAVNNILKKTNEPAIHVLVANFYKRTITAKGLSL